MPILDAYGNPIPAQPELRSAQTARVASYARPWHESALAGLKPRDVALRLHEADGGSLRAQALLFADMADRDPIIGAAMQQRALAVARLPWKVEAPPNPSAAETRAAEGVADMLAGAMDALEDVIVALMDAVGHGYSAVEIEWQRSAGAWIPDLYPRPHDWFVQAIDGRSIELQTDAGQEPLRPFGWIMHQPRLARAGYQGRGGVYRALVWPFVYKSFAVGDFAEFLETFGLPFVVGKYGREASEDDKTRLLQAVSALSHSARAIMPLEMQLEVQRVASAGSESPHLAMVQWADDAIARAILGQTLSMQAKSTGLGSGVADLQSQVRADLRDADARQLAGTLTRELLWPLAALNFGASDPRRGPRLVFDVAETEDIATYAQAIPQLAAAGVQIPVSWVRQKLGIPAAADGEPVVGAAAAVQLVPQPAPVAAGSATPHVAIATRRVALQANPQPGAAPDPAAWSSPQDDPTPVSLQTAQLEAEAAPAWSSMLDGVRAIVAQAQSLPALREQLLAAYGGLPTEQLAAVMAMAQCAAQLAGMHDVHAEATNTPGEV